MRPENITRIANRKGERGNVLAYTVMSAFFLFLAVGLCVDLSHLYLAKTELQNTADAAALAGVVDRDRTEAASAARANGGELVSFDEIGTDLIVSVRVGRAVAQARATIGTPQLPTLDSRDRPSG